MIKLLNIIREQMKEQGCSSTDIAKATKEVTEQFGVILPDFYVKDSKMTDDELNDMIDFIASHPRGRGHRIPTFEDFAISKIIFINKALINKDGDTE